MNPKIRDHLLSVRENEVSSTEEKEIKRIPMHLNGSLSVHYSLNDVPWACGQLYPGFLGPYLIGPFRAHVQDIETCWETLVNKLCSYIVL